MNSLLNTTPITPTQTVNNDVNHLENAEQSEVTDPGNAGIDPVVSSIGYIPPSILSDNASKLNGKE